MRTSPYVTMFRPISGAARSWLYDNGCFLATHVHVRYMLSPVRRLSVCNVRAPYSGGSNFRQYFYGIRYLGHPLIRPTSRSRKPLRLADDILRLASRLPPASRGGPPASRGLRLTPEIG